MDCPEKCFLFDCFPAERGTALIVAVAEAMAEGLDSEQIGLLGSFVSAVGDMLAYKSAQLQRNEQTCPKKRERVKDGDAGKDNTDEIPDNAKEGAQNSKQYLLRKNQKSPQGGDLSDK